MYSRYAELRDSKGYTDYKVAQLTGIARSTISDWKRNVSSPNAAKLLKIAKVLDCSIEELIKQEG